MSDFCHPCESSCRYTGDDGSYRQRAGHERGEDKRHRGPILVNRDMQAEVGMRVRKSKERLEFVQQNGWEDLSEGRAGSIVSLLVSNRTRDRVSSVSSKLTRGIREMGGSAW
ncbi:hypothetical protein GUITHDRAFT_151595 [Guillardia theta CCMP2712]|uniref:Uncharacterized protein n=1 Tax=Guillardia theta (strain CCMP2712) TaxID=905079 RepID=L1JKL6_GUITC|nr:hypothetical protein GUITHDRAFT_151595 [Guillardia theta CCMP2712]EKX49046.1 hypothetical protein GUITHDRAFT_151595 [Guillardia theta CCMP2712]|eukprot:XP_005836026.1 hypothetical protein GUITHDRAFT_151595 [Guillardia theta CCMP2712]